MSKPVSQMGRDELITKIADLTAANKLLADALANVSARKVQLEDDVERLEERLYPGRSRDMRYE